MNSRILFALYDHLIKVESGESQGRRFIISRPSGNILVTIEKQQGTVTGGFVVLDESLASEGKDES